MPKKENTNFENTPRGSEILTENPDDFYCDESAAESETLELTRDVLMGIKEEMEEINGRAQAAEAAFKKERARAEDIASLLSRLQADFDNYKKRTGENMKNLKDEGRAEVLEQLLPAIDNFLQAINLVGDEKIKEGLNIMHRNFLSILDSFGVAEIPALNEEFDPNFHNAVMQEKASKKENVNKITEVYNAGYKMGARVLRHSVVKVAK